MITCPKCNKELSDGTKFCDNCGTRVSETIFCPTCGKQTSTEFASCQNCGAPITGVPAGKNPGTPPIPPKTKFPKKTIVIGVICVIAVVVLILAISLLSGGKAKNDATLYAKDGEIFFADMNKDSAPWQLTSRLIDSGDGMSENDYDELGLYTYISEDGKYVFFPDKVGSYDDDGGCNLYYKKTAKPDAEVVKIDSGVVYYAVNNSATLVTYLKDENIYQYDLGGDSREKIASDVEGFLVSDDGKKIGYVDSEYDMYLQYVGKDIEKVASNVSSLEYVTEDLKTAYYTKDDGSLYKYVEGKDKVKVASDVYDVIKIYDSGEIYYLTKEDAEISLIDYVTDDMKDTDGSIVKPSTVKYPQSPKSPSWLDYDTDEEYEAAYEKWEEIYDEWEQECERIYAEYRAALEAYDEKEFRDELREKLAEKTLEQSEYSLCFYNGTEEVVITDSFAYDLYSTNPCADDAPIVIYQAYNRADIEKVKLSEIESVYDIEEMVEDALSSSEDRYIAVRDTSTLIEQENKTWSYRINSSGTIVYYISSASEDEYQGELYRISITDGKVGKPEVYDSDVCVYYCYFISDTEIQYFKDYNDGKGELYINKNKIDYDVEAFCDIVSDSGKVYYFTDWNDDNYYGTLKVYDGKKSSKISDDVHSFHVTSDDRVLYLYDYSNNYYNGELHEWSNNETRKIDDDVNSILFYNGYSLTKYRGDVLGMIYELLLYR